MDKVDNPRLITFSNLDPAGKTEFVYACGECGKAWGASLEGAKRCCKQEYCECGNKKRSYIIKCLPCQYQKRIDESETDNSYDGPVFNDETDKYYSEIDELIDDLEEDELPDYAWACDLIKFRGVDSSDILESLISDEHHEDACDSLVDVDGLNKFLSEWNKKQTLVSWSYSYKKKIDVKEYLKPSEAP